MKANLTKTNNCRQQGRSPVSVVFFMLLLLIMQGASAQSGGPAESRTDSLPCQNCPLPLHRFELSASISPDESQFVKLEWIAENEMNTRSFVVERSTDGFNYEPVHTKAALGFTNTVTHYYYNDDITFLLQRDMIYYRAIAIDLNGRKGYSNIVPVRPGKPGAIQAWPNPFTGQLNIQVSLEKPGPVTVCFFDMNGKKVRSHVFNAARGANSLSVTGLENLPGGIYLLELRAGRLKLESRRIFKS